jgi:phage major head subunit gpT-like protein
VFRRMIPKLREWFSSQECQALDASDFYSEKYWMNAVEEVEDMEDDDMDMVSDVNSTAGRLICFTSSNSVLSLLVHICENNEIIKSVVHV